MCHGIEGVKALEYIATIDIDTTPKKQLESVIKILVSVCVDLNNQMQTAQATMGAMSELIEDLLKCGEDVEALTTSNKKLRTLVGDLKEKVEHWKDFNKHLMSFNRPEEHQRETLNDLIELKIVKEGLEKQVKDLKAAYKDRAEKYDEAFRWKNMRKAEIEALKIKLKDETELREEEEEQYKEKIAEEREKLRKEKEKRIKVKEERSNLDIQNKNNLRKLGELQVEMIELKRNHEEQIVTWEKERGIGDKRREDLKMRVAGLQSDISRQDHLHKEAMKKKGREINVLEDRVRDRHNDLIGIKIELEEVTKDLKDTQRLLEISKKRAEDAEKMVDELKKEKAQTHLPPPVANIEKPRPDRKVEEDESEDQTVDTTLLQTTGGGIYGDTEGGENETFPMPDPPPSPRGKEREQVRRRGEGVVRVDLEIALKMGAS